VFWTFSLTMDSMVCKYLE